MAYRGALAESLEIRHCRMSRSTGASPSAPAKRTRLLRRRVAGLLQAVCLREQLGIAGRRLLL